MAFSPDSFKKALGKPMGAPAAAGAPAGGGLDMDSLMGEPKGIEDTEADVEGPEGEAGESSLEQALENAGIIASPEQISEIKGILGLSGGMAPEGTEPGMGKPSPVSSAPKAPSSKIGRMFSK